jgi:hypothetical protein
VYADCLVSSIIERGVHTVELTVDIIWKEAVAVLSQYLPGGREEDHEKSQDSRCPG